MIKIIPTLMLCTAVMLPVLPALSSEIELDFLSDVERKFDACTSIDGQKNVVMQLINHTELRSAESLESIDPEDLVKGIGPAVMQYTNTSGEKEFNFDKTNPIAMAIRLGDVNKVEKFLSVVDDVNDPTLTSWGYRQPYYLAHIALDPSDSNTFYFVNRLRIIDLLGEKSADFNILNNGSFLGVYDNPPLVAAGLNNNYDHTDILRAHALLYGADPKIMGSSKSLVCINPTTDRPLESYGTEANKLIKMAFEDLLTLPASEHFKFAPSVLAKFKELKVEQQNRLDTLSF